MWVKQKKCSEGEAQKVCCLVLCVCVQFGIIRNEKSKKIVWIWSYLGCWHNIQTKLSLKLWSISSNNAIRRCSLCSINGNWMHMHASKMPPTQPILVLKPCNSHDKIRNTHRFDRIPRFSSNQIITSDYKTRSQQCLNHNLNQKQHRRQIYIAVSIRQTTVIIYSMLLFAIFALVAECRQLPQINIQNPGESSHFAYIQRSPNLLLSLFFVNRMF